MDTAENIAEPIVFNDDHKEVISNNTDLIKKCCLFSAQVIALGLIIKKNISYQINSDKYLPLI